MTGAANLLRHETSPYLLQHASNPVHWHPWGAAALEAARASGRPILLSIGYAACHWCHVMAHESFEDDAVATVMNTLFVNVKVDREERPDIDHLYMSALQAMGEHGGWPLTMFLAPDGAPFWGGTYFPPEPRWGKPSFRQVLEGVAEAYRTQHESVRKNSDALRRALAAMSAAQPGGMLGPADLQRAGAALLRITDPDQGGMRGAPKFPNAPIFRFLWHEGFRTGHAAFAEAVHLLLVRMSQGGIYDHLGGGYARYSTDADWLVPHFEKMLYDNAQILDLLALAHAARPDPLYAERAAETVTWMDRDMTAAEASDGSAAFAASEDADSEGEEGKFYVWDEQEIDDLLGRESAAFKRAYDVTPGGNWEGSTILRRVSPRGSDAEEAALARGRAILLAKREQRVRPGRDDKVLADWNGLAVAALARASAVFDRPDWLRRAERAFAFVIGRMQGADFRIAHAWRLDRVTAAGLLEDQASMARAAIALHIATGEAAYLAQSLRIVAAAIEHFADRDGSFFTTANDAADVPLGPAARPRTATDTATPAGNGVMAEVLAGLFHLTGDPAWRDRATELIRAFGGAGDQLAAMPGLLAAADLLEGGASVVVAGDARADALAMVVRTAPDPATLLLRAMESAPLGHPAYGKATIDAGPAAYVCRAGVCGLPVTDAPALARTLATRA